MSTGIAALLRLDPAGRKDFTRAVLIQLLRPGEGTPRAVENGHAARSTRFMSGHRNGVIRPARGPRLGRPADVVQQVRGVLAERVVISTPLDPFLDLQALADYSGLSRKTLRGLMAREGNALPHYRLTDTGKIVVKRSEFDDFMREFRHTQSALDELIDERRRQRAAHRNGTKAS